MHFNVFDRPVYLLASSNKWRRIIWQAIVERYEQQAPAAVMARLALDRALPALRGVRGAALPGHTLVVYDPDSRMVCDILACGRL